ncbi:MAG: hypothetical protein Q4F00_11300 [bacterium]|nr:hypothetical protein [bacterium]
MEFVALSGGNLIIAGGIAVIAVGVGGTVWLNRHKKPKTAEPELTQKDKDLLDLIGELAAVYEKTDQYLNRD